MKKQYVLYTVISIVLLFIAVSVIYRDIIIITCSKLISSFRSDEPAKKLIIGRAGDSISLDPGNSTEIDSVKVTVNIYETLVKHEKDGKEIVPCLATSWKTSEDGLTWTFRLRQGVKFHDGTVFNADAVVFNFERWMDKDNQYHNGEFSYWKYVFGGFPGFVKSVKALSDYSVEIRLTKPYAPFLNTIAMPVFGIGSPEAIKKYGDKIFENPVGTGPFKFKSWEHGISIVLSRNEKYWGMLAKVNEVEFKVVPSNVDRLKQLREGIIHIADNLGPDDVDEIQDDGSLQLLLRPYFNVGYIALNNEKSPFDNRDVRLAISHAINKEDMIKKVFANLARPAKTLIPPILWGYNESIEDSEYNPEKAKQLLEKAGYPRGFEITLWVMSSSRDYFPKPIDTAEYIKECLKEVNIDVTIVSYNLNEYLSRISKGEHEMALIGWTGDNIDPDNFLYTLLASENAKPGNAGNYAFYKNKEVDLLLSQARQASDIVFRKSLYGKLLEIVNYDMPTVPLVHTMPVLAADHTVKGYTPYMTGVESLEGVDIKVENN